VHFNRFLPCRLFIALALLGTATVSTHATEESGASPAAIKAGLSFLRTLETAGAAYAAGQLSNALDKLDVCDQIHPDIPDTWNMRGAIYADQHQYDKASAAFAKAAELNPGDFWPQYNIAQLLLVQKMYPQAVDAFNKLAVYNGHEELVAFKIVYADLMQGKMDASKKVLDAMKFPCDTPAYYFAHSAWGYAHANQKDGDYWLGAGMKVFGPEKCLSFYDTLVQAGWVPARNADGSYPEQNTLSALPAITPAQTFPGVGGGLQ